MQALRICLHTAGLATEARLSQIRSLGRSWHKCTGIIGGILHQETWRRLYQLNRWQFSPEWIPVKCDMFRVFFCFFYCTATIKSLQAREMAILGYFCSYSSPTKCWIHARCRSTELIITTAHSTPGCLAGEKQLKIAASLVCKLLLSGVHLIKRACSELAALSRKDMALK